MKNCSKKKFEHTKKMWKQKIKKCSVSSLHKFLKKDKKCVFYLFTFLQLCGLFQLIILKEFQILKIQIFWFKKNSNLNLKGKMFVVRFSYRCAITGHQLLKKLLIRPCLSWIHGKGWEWAEEVARLHLFFCVSEYQWEIDNSTKNVYRTTSRINLLR